MCKMNSERKCDPENLILRMIHRNMKHIRILSNIAQCLNSQNFAKPNARHTERLNYVNYVYNSSF